MAHFYRARYFFPMEHGEFYTAMLNYQGVLLGVLDCNLLGTPARSASFLWINPHHPTALWARISQGTGNPHELLARKSPLCSTVNGLGHSVSHQVLGQVSQRWVPNILNNSSLKSTSSPFPACSLSVSLGIRFMFLMASVWRPITCTWLQWKEN